MSEHRFTLKDWSAMLVVAVVLMFAVWHLTTASESPNREAADQVHFWLKMQYKRYYLTHRPKTDARLGHILNRINDLRLTDVNARGTADDMVVQVLIKPMAVDPPGVAHERYFRMHFTRYGGWQLDGEVSRLDWYLAIF